MKVEKHPSLNMADAVLALVSWFAEGSDDGESGLVRAFSNGREQGYRITIDRQGASVHVAFAQQRSSDNIVVYTWGSVDFQTGLPSEDDWGEGKEFPPGEIASAALFVVKQLRHKPTQKRRKTANS